MLALLVCARRGHGELARAAAPSCADGRHHTMARRVDSVCDRLATSRTAGRRRATSMRTDSSDDQLLTSEDPEAFGVFYVRHHSGIQSFFARRVGDDRAGDLTAETFAAALIARRRFVPGDTPGRRMAVRHRTAAADRSPAPRRGRD